MFASRREAAARKHQNLFSLSNSFRPDLARRRSHGAEDIPGAVCQMPGLLAINLASGTFVLQDEGLGVKKKGRMMGQVWSVAIGK